VIGCADSQTHGADQPRVPWSRDAVAGILRRYRRAPSRSPATCRTRPTLVYRRTKNLRAVRLLLGRTKRESTVRYLAIEVDDALLIAEQTQW
jgi:hypothetical protein